MLLPPRSWHRRGRSLPPCSLSSVHFERSLTRLDGMEAKLKPTEWSIDEVYENIKENYDEEVAKKFKGEFDISSSL